MTRVFFRHELETVAIYWRVSRSDGVTLGFTSHDKDLTFEGVAHRAAPGMNSSAIRRTASLDLDSAEVQGSLAHDMITNEDIVAGRFDGADVEIGVVDWESLERTRLYFGEMGAVSSEAGGFEAELLSSKSKLECETVPRTSPTCRARFCGPGCTLSASRFTHEAILSHIEEASGEFVFVGGPAPEKMLDGLVRWVDGPTAGMQMRVLDASQSGLVLDLTLSSEFRHGARVLLREGCDHTLATCSARFANSVNFRGEPFLPGNDALVRYPTSSR